MAKLATDKGLNRRKIVERLDDAEVLEQIVVNEKDKSVREAAVSRLKEIEKK